MFSSIVGSVQGDSLSMMIAAFYAMRLGQYMFNTGLGIQIAQSNTSAVLLSAYGLANFGSGPFSSVSTIVLLADAYIGGYLFVTERGEDISEYIGCSRKRLARPAVESNGDNDGNRDNSFYKI